MIVLKDICFSYEDKEVIKNCSLSFDANELHLLIGPNGAGKTTLAMMLKGLLKPSRGRVVSPRGEIDDLRKEMGFLFQFPEDLFFNDTVSDEIAYGARKRKLEDAEEKLNGIVDLLGLNRGILDSSPFDLSYGEKRLVALASILIWEPSYLILDEPFSGIDWQFRGKIAEIIKSLKDKIGVTIISQDLDSIISFVDKVSLILDGKAVFSLPPAEVNWDEVYGVGCDIPSAVRLAKKLKDNGIELAPEVFPYTIEGLVDALKR
jgi:energy-coupling factor transport system ATP-binding protein